LQGRGTPPNAVSSAPRYRFGELLLSPNRRLLLRGADEVALPPRCLDLLVVLVAERRRAVSREELHERVWGGAAVTDGAFTQAVRTLRRALGDDDPKQPLFIRTVARTGYQFVYPEVVEESDDTPLRAPDASTATANAPRTVLATAGRAALGAAGAGVLAALAMGPLLVLAGGAHWRLLPVLATIGALCGAWGGAFVGAGFTLGRRLRGSLVAAVAGGALGGALAGGLAHGLVRATLSELLGRTPNAFGGAVEGLVLGGAVALGLAVGRRAGGRGVLAAALGGAIAAGLLAVTGARLIGGSLDTLAAALRGTQLIAPLGTYLGESGAARVGAVTGPATRLAVSLVEGLLFGGGLAAALARRDGRRFSDR